MKRKICLEGNKASDWKNQFSEWEEISGQSGPMDVLLWDARTAKQSREFSVKDYEIVEEQMLSPFLDKMPRLSLNMRSGSSVIVILPDSREVKNNSLTGMASCYLQGYIKSAACEFASAGIRVNGIAVSDGVPRESLIQLIRFLASAEAYVTGQIFYMRKAVREEKRHEGKPVAFITGAGQGIGLAMTKRFVNEGYLVCANDKEMTPALDILEKEGNVHPVIADISDSRQVGRCFKDLEQHFGRLDVLIGNAAFMQMSPCQKQLRNVIQRHLDVNIKGHVRCLELGKGLMEKQGYGRIILMSSMFGILGWKNASAYGATKAALMGLAAYLSEEWEKNGITVTAVAPGVIDTPQLQADADDFGITREEMIRIYEKDIPLGYVGTPDQVAAMVFYLAQYGNPFFSGQTLQTNGGECRCTPAVI